MKIAVYFDFNYASYEIISKAYELKKQIKELKDEKCEIIALAISKDISKEYVNKAYQAGADEFILIQEDNINHINQAKLIVEWQKENNADVFLFNATLEGRMLAPRVTTMLDTGLVADCTGLEFILKNDNLELAPTRPTFGNELMATILSKKKPSCATIRPFTFKAKFECAACDEYKIFKKDIDFSLNIFPDEILTKQIASSSLKDAKIIFAGGFGLVDGKENIYIEKLKQLANKYKASFAVTRKVVDFGIVENTYQVGQTGSTVTPDLYVAFGISGALQHIFGMKNSKKVIAINTDCNAEIFKYSDYKIVADAKKVIDDLLLD
ncbi:electron transfer flavoprotein subunit alpha/FixB family protein [bacterium]|nr:electron transfer flavoprotein subunit alpha/FixB family protein [bacterium]